jgi:pectin methylesterase-like acyl-CoA thioesterase
MANEFIVKNGIGIGSTGIFAHGISGETGLTPSSDNIIPTQRAVKSYVDAYSAGNYDTKTIHVSLDGVDSADTNGMPNNPYRTLVYALSQITDNSSTNRYVIKIGPGIYVENNPITMKEYVTVVGLDSEIVTRISAQNATSNIFNMVSHTAIENLTLYGTTTGYAVSHTSTLDCILRNISFFQCGYGVLLNNASATMDIMNLSAINVSGTMAEGVVVQAGNMVLDNYRILASTTATRTLYVTGSDSIFTMRGYISFSPNVVTAQSYGDSSRSIVTSSNIVFATDSYIVDGGGKVSS